MIEFRINNFLSLRLEDRTTNIYVNGVLFRQCKYIMLNIPIENIESFDEIDSIDEAADILGWTAEGQERVNYEIDPETEFWGHCSNLQAWFENDYDTRLLHSNLAFSLLKRLVDVGDPLAKKVFKEEIANRFESGYPTTITYIVEEKLLHYLSREELKQLVENNFSAIINVIEKLLSDLKFDILEPFFLEIKASELIPQHLNPTLSVIDEVNEEEKYRVFSLLFYIASRTKSIEEYFLYFLETVDKIFRYKYLAFSDLIESTEGNELLDEHFPRIEALFLNVVNHIDGLPNEEKCKQFISLIEAVKNTELIKKHYPTLLDVSIDLITFIGKIFPNLLRLINRKEVNVEEIPSGSLEYFYYDALKTIDNELGPIHLNLKG